MTPCLKNISWLNEAFVWNILKQSAIFPEIDVHHYDIDNAIPKGENYCSALYSLNITYSKKNSENVNKKSFILKILPEGEYVQKFVKYTNMFDREMRMYYETLPKFHKLSNKQFSPEAFTSSETDVIVLEDLKGTGYKMADRRSQLDYDHSKMAIQHLAEFHATSLSANLNGYDLRNKYSESLYLDENSETVKSFMECTFRTLAAEVNSWPDYGMKYGPKMFQLAETVWEKVKKVVRPYEHGKGLNVLTHSDFWINNMMFKYNEDKKVVDVKLIDFQVVRYASPALDILYFLHTSVRENVSHDKLIEDYYVAFLNTTTAELRGEKNENVIMLTLNELRKQIEEKAFFGLYAACTVLSAVVAQPTNQIDLTELSEETISQETGNEHSPLANIFAGEHFKILFLKKLQYFEDIDVL